MKNLIKMTTIIADFSITALTFTACSGNDGIDGAIGPQGPAGVESNANVKMYTYSFRTFSQNVSYSIPNVNESYMDSCFVLAYYNLSNEPSSIWYSVPGMGPSGIYDTRSYYGPLAQDYDYTVKLMNPNGVGGYTPDVTFAKFRIIVVPASSLTPMSKSKNLPDFSDYRAVVKYYNLSE